MMRHLIKYIFLALAFCAFAPMATAQNDAMNLERLASKGERESMYKLGECYFNGTGGVKRDLSRAIQWYEKSAKKGYGPAQRAMGLCYLHGTGVSADYKKAWNLFNKAAKSGDANALYQMAIMCREGLHVKKSERQYLEYLDKAASKGDSQALLRLANMYLDGDASMGIRKDETRGFNLLQRAANAGNSEAQYLMGLCYAEGVGLKQPDMKRAFESFQRAARSGYIDAYFNLGLCYYLGQGTAQDYTDAALWLKRAAQNNVTDAFTLLGNIYYYGLDVQSDSRTALDYYIRGMRGGDMEAVEQLASIYLDDSAMITDQSNVYELFRAAATQGAPQGYTALGVCYEKGIGVDPSPAQALDNYRKAADKGNGIANLRLYRMYRNGELGQRVDYVAAIESLRKAAATQNSDALYLMGIELIDGTITNADPNLGVDYLKRAADLSSSKAGAYLGNLYYRGDKIVTRDYDKAFEYYKTFMASPNLVDPDIRQQAYRNIGACYRFGRGTPINENLANMYTRKAYEDEDPDDLDF